MNKNKDKYRLKNCLFLFDIDGTIMDSKGAGKRAFISAFEQVLNIKIIKNINFLGGIDNVIFKELYNMHNFPAKLLNNKWNEFKETYLNILLSSSIKNNWEIFPNVDYTIKLLYETSNIALVTGNIKIGAIIKLGVFNLDKYFFCGGFGDVVNNRKTIVENAINISESTFKKTFKKENIFLFGDTEIDIISAIDNNITPVLIDPNKRHKNNVKKWSVKYYSDFLKIDTFFKKIMPSVIL